MEHFDVIIIGGGAAGLFARANLASENALLLESGNECGRKLLITAGGMCNLTNSLEPGEFLTHYGSKSQRNFLLVAIQNFPPMQLRSWFAKRNLPTVVRSDGKVFPASLDARDVRSCLIASSTIPIRYHHRVTSIEADAGDFIITTERGCLHCHSLIVATGGMSYPRTGSDGSLYPLLRRLGHTIVKPKPALVGLVIRNWHYSSLSGSSMTDVKVTATHMGASKPYYSGRGSVLFTHRGLSGPPILTLSGESESGDTITIRFCDDAAQKIARLFDQSPAMQVTTALRDLGLTKALALTLAQQAAIEGGERYREVDAARRKRLFSLLDAHPFVVESTMGFASAMATRGGVALDEVNRKTMESKVLPGLFFCGEVLDYDGESGGFNLQGAFSTALLAAQHTRSAI